MLLSQNPANKALVLADSRASAAPYFFLVVIPFGVITTYNSTKNIKLALHIGTRCCCDPAQTEKSRVVILLVFIKRLDFGATRELHACVLSIRQANQIDFR